MKKKPKKKRRKVRQSAHQEAVYICDSCGEEIVAPVAGTARAVRSRACATGVRRRVGRQIRQASNAVNRSGWRAYAEVGGREPGGQVVRRLIMPK